MSRFLFQIWESLRFAGKALKENLLRTILSLLGVTVGIFAIIGVLTFVDALENSIKNSLSFVGDKVIYIQKMPWTFSSDYPWWKYMNRPDPSIEEFRFLKDKLELASAISVFAVKGNFTLKYNKSILTGIFTQGVTYEHKDVGDIRVAKGRYFTEAEAENGGQVVLLGVNVANDLFGQLDPIGKTIKMKGKSFRVLGILEAQGANLLDAPSNDNTAIIPYSTLSKMYAKGKRGVNPTIAIKGYETDPNLLNLEYEIKGVLRSYRGIKPVEEDDFALNRPEMLAGFISGIISVLTMAGWVIGSFSMLVGCFGIANIMFVSVKERTSQIGVQKSLGAKNYFILAQFLFEAIFLSCIGGLAGLVLVSLLGFLSTETFIIRLNWDNVAVGMSVSIAIGLLAGVTPALSASRLNPVVAMRSV